MKKRLMKAGMSGAGGVLGPLFRKGEDADMRLPDWILGFGLLLIAGGVALAVVKSSALAALIGAAALILTGAAAILCYRNQKIFIQDDERFEYRTFLGNVRTFRFDEIEEIRFGKDSVTLVARGEKVHIESAALLSETLRERIEEILARMQG